MLIARLYRIYLIVTDSMRCITENFLNNKMSDVLYIPEAHLATITMQILIVELKQDQEYINA